MPDQQHPLYNGPSPEPARTPQAAIPESFPLQDDWQQGLAQQTQNAIDFRDAAIDRIEYTIDQTRQTQTDQALASMQADFIAKSQLPNGQGGFYDANGAFNPSRFESWLNTHLSKLDTLKGGYIRPESRERAAQSLAQIKQKASERMQLSVLQQLGSRAQDALRDNVNALAAAGQYDQAIAVYQGAPDYAASDAERAYGVQQLTQQKHLDAITLAVTHGDETAALEAYRAAKGVLTPANLAKAVNALRHMGGGEARIAQVKDKSTGKDKTTVIPPQLPCGAPDYLYDHYKENFENLKDPDVHQRSVNLVNEFIYHGGITRSENEDGALQEKDYVLQIAKQLGVEDYARGEIERAQKLLGSSSVMDAKEWVNQLPSDALFSDSQKSFIKAQVDRLAEITAKIEEDGGDDDIESEAKGIKAFLGTMEAEGRQRKQQVFGTALRQLSVWKGENNDASSQQQAIKLMDFAEAELQRLDDQGNPVYPDSAGERKGQAAASFRASRLAQDYLESYSNPNLNLRRLNAQAYRDQRARDIPQLAAEQLKDKAPVDARAEAGRSVRFAPCLTTEAAAENLPDTTKTAYIAFPKGTAPKYKQMHFHNGNSSRIIEVREMDGLTSPTLSSKAQLQLGIFNNNAPANVYFDGNGGAQLVAEAIDAFPDAIGYTAGLADASATLAGNNLIGNLAPYRQAIINAARQAGIDPNFLTAIAAVETGWGTSRAFRQHNNPGGLMTGPNASQFKTFASVDDGLLSMAENLRKNYFDKGLTTIPSIGAKYAPPGADNDTKGTNATWVGSVSRIYGGLTSAAQAARAQAPVKRKPKTLEQTLNDGRSSNPADYQGLFPEDEVNSDGEDSTAQQSPGLALQ